MNRVTNAAQRRDVADAILLTSPESLQSIINQGYDINTPLSTESIYNFNLDTCGDEFNPPQEEIVALDKSTVDAVAYPLHLAIIVLYHKAQKYSSYPENQAIETIQILLRNGADYNLGCKGLLLLNVGDYKWTTFDPQGSRNHPIHLAMALKKYGKADRKMDEVISVLQTSMKKQMEKATSPSQNSLKTTAVLESVANTYKSMLFSDDFSDATFQCSDGVSVPAHKFILAASSPYFKTAFQGDWTENNAEGIWKTSHSSSLIKSVLSLIYTGSVEECQKLLKDNQSDPLGLLKLACEYDIKPLVLISVDNCIKHLKLDNVRVMLQAAHLHSCEQLKKACFKFVKANATKALMCPDMMSLATEDPELWAELGMFLNGKRPRSDE